MATIKDVHDNPVEVEIYKKRPDYSSVFLGDKLILWPTELIDES